MSILKWCNGATLCFLSTMIVAGISPQVQALPKEPIEPSDFPIEEPTPNPSPSLQTYIYPNGTLLKGSGPEIYVIEAGQRRHVPDPITFNAMGFKGDAVKNISDTELNSIVLGAPLPQIVAPAPAPALSDPLSATQFTKVTNSGARTMYSEANLQRSGPLAGQLDIVTETRNTVKLTGFTGGVFVLLRDSNGAVVAVTGLRQFGVDGTWIGSAKRKDYWKEQFDPRVAAATAQLEIVQTHAPKNRIAAILAQIEEYRRQAEQAFGG